VDVQNDFCDRNGVFGKAGNDLSMVDAMLPRLSTLIESARAAGVTVIFIQAIYDPEFLFPAWHERNARLGFETPRCIDGSWGADYYQVAPQAGDIVIRKHRYSAFVDTELDAVLRSRRIETVVTTGVATNICVESTARDAFMKGYYVVLPQDAAAAYSEQQHKASLASIAIGFGVVTQVSDLLTEWEQAKKAA
jgi:ureidoacrylate peracid hydrolase